MAMLKRSVTSVPMGGEAELRRNKARARRTHGPGGRDEAGKLIPIDVKAGDRVLFGKWSGTEVKIDGQELLIMKESDIMGIIDEPAAKKKAA